MFSQQQKKAIAALIEAHLLSINHPEMPTRRVMFKLRVAGKEDWSYAEIEPNWKFDPVANPPGINPHNEAMANRPQPVDNFNGDDQLLIASAMALLKLDGDGALVPHGIGGHARNIIGALAARLHEADKLRAEVDAFTKHVGAPSFAEARDVLLRTKQQDEEKIEWQFNKIKELGRKLESLDSTCDGHESSPQSL